MCLSQLVQVLQHPSVFARTCDCDQLAQALPHPSMSAWRCDRSTWEAVPPNEALRLWLKVQLQQKPCESLHPYQHSRQHIGLAEACCADGQHFRLADVCSADEQQAPALMRTRRLMTEQAWELSRDLEHQDALDVLAS